MLEELVASGIKFWCGYDVNQAGSVGDFLWKVFARVEELEKAADGVNWLGEVDGAGLTC